MTKDINDGLGDGIYLTWSGALKDLPKARKAARAMAAMGTTFRGCSFDQRIFVKESCPVCGCWGLKEVDTPYDHDVRKPPVSVQSHWQSKRKKNKA